LTGIVESSRVFAGRDRSLAHDTSNDAISINPGEQRCGY
jgi:hypothetical protein